MRYFGRWPSETLNARNRPDLIHAATLVSDTRKLRAISGGVKKAGRVSLGIGGTLHLCNGGVLCR